MGDKESVFDNYLLFIRDKLISKTDGYNKIIKYKVLTSLLSDLKIAKKFHWEFISELQKRGLIKIVDKQNIEILVKDLKQEKDYNQEEIGYF